MYRCCCFLYSDGYDSYIRIVEPDKTLITTNHKGYLWQLPFIWNIIYPQQLLKGIIE